MACAQHNLGHTLRHAQEIAPECHGLRDGDSRLTEREIQVRQNNPGISFGDLSKTIGNQWKELGAEDKHRYLSLESEDKERYQDEMGRYRRLAGLPDKPPKRRRSAGAPAAHAHIRSIDELVGVEEIDEADSDGGIGGLGKRRATAMDLAASRKVSLNSSSRKTTARPKARASHEAVDWVQCDACGSWRFFDPGLEPSDVPDSWKCEDNERQCGKFEVEEDFMRDWTQLMGSDTQQALYTFVLEGQEFSVYDLYWSVMSLGGYEAVSKWKDVGNEMMWRKLQCLVSKAPGKNYGLIRNQWDRWNLTKYHEMHKGKALPEVYLSPAFDANETGPTSTAISTGPFPQRLFFRVVNMMLWSDECVLRAQLMFARSAL